MTQYELSPPLNDSSQHDIMESTPSNENPLFYWLRKLENSPEENTGEI